MVVEGSCLANRVCLPAIYNDDDFVNILDTDGNNVGTCTVPDDPQVVECGSAWGNIGWTNLFDCMSPLHTTYNDSCTDFLLKVNRTSTILILPTEEGDYSGCFRLGSALYIIRTLAGESAFKVVDLR
jgi:hypothetical protein